MDSLFYTISTGTKQKFSNEGHFKNFVKYLFSNSNAHRKNEYTAYNFFNHNLENSKTLSFIKPDQNVKAMNAFNKQFKDEYPKYKEYYNDLNYVIFAYNFGDTIITNILDVEKEEVVFDLDPLTAQLLLEQYFKNDGSKFDSKLNEFFQDKKIINYRNATLDQRKAIEFDIHKRFNKIGAKATFTISHNDQELYHIHRIIKK